MSKKENNFAFVDGQNLYMGTNSDKPAWKVDLVRFRTYLSRKYNIERAYYFLGFVNEKNQDLYDSIQEAGFVLKFKKHNDAMLGTKKGNVDTDIVFTIMKKLYKQELPGKVILISGDGDYKMMVDFLIKERKFKKILFPNKNFASSLYKSLSPSFFDYLGNNGVRRKIEYKKRKVSLGN